MRPFLHRAKDDLIRGAKYVTSQHRSLEDAFDEMRRIDLTEAEIKGVWSYITIIQDQRRAEREFELILTDDDEMLAYAQRLLDKPFPPVVRADVYGDRLRQRCRALVPYQVSMSKYHDDPRVPVMMLGSREMIASQWTNKSAWGNQVCARYLRRVKFTGLTKDDYVRMNNRLSRGLRKLGIYQHKPYWEFPGHFPSVPNWRERDEWFAKHDRHVHAWINGVERFDITQAEWKQLTAEARLKRAAELKQKREALWAQRNLIAAEDELKQANREFDNLRRKVNEAFGHTTGYRRSAKKNAGGLAAR